MQTEDGNLDKIKVLILEGSTDVADLLKKIFSELGFKNVTVANDGFQGVQIMKQNHIDLILTDRELKVVWNLSNAKSVQEAKIGDMLPLSGVHFTQRLRHSKKSPNPYMPVMMMIDNAVEHDIIDARDSGVNEVITRPINAQDFCERIISIIDNPRMFISTEIYKGPCRRRKKMTLRDGQDEHRKNNIRAVKRKRG